MKGFLRMHFLRPLRLFAVGLVLASVVGSAASAGATGRRVVATPVITVQPTSVSVVVGGTATFRAAASTGAVHWVESQNHGSSWSVVVGATKTKLSLAGVGAGQNGLEVEAVFANAAGVAKSAAATLSVQALSAPQVVSSPAATIKAPVGQGVTFSAAASGVPVPMATWYTSVNGGASWSAIRGSAGKSSYTITSVATAMSGEQFKAVFSNSQGSAATDVSILSVTGVATAPPVVTSQPRSVVAVAGQGVSLLAQASGDPSPSIQWMSSQNGTTWSVLTGATSPTLTLGAVTVSMSGTEYQAVFSNSAGQAESAAVTLTVYAQALAAPTFSSQPVSTTTGDGYLTYLLGTATGFPAPSYAWQVSVNGGMTWMNVSGATSPSLGLTANLSMSGYQYRIVATNAVGSATSNAATLIVSGMNTVSNQTWAGYVDQGAVFTSVSGTWVVPAVTCGSSSSYNSQWVGIDGAGSQSVEQIGTEAVCSGGAVSYDAWWEMYGDTTAAAGGGFAVQLGTALYPVSAGDTVSGSVSLVSGTWTLTLNDQTQGWAFTQSLAEPSPAPAQLSAEWVVERRTNCGVNGCAPGNLASSTPVVFTNAAVSTATSSGTIGSFGPEALQMYANGGSPDATPSDLSADGSSFSVGVTAPVM